MTFQRPSQARQWRAKVMTDSLVLIGLPLLTLLAVLYWFG
jgi:hypothetical protein